MRALVLMLSLVSVAHAIDVPPKPVNGLADPDHVLSDDTVVERALVGYAQGTTVRYGVAIFKTLGNEAVEDFTIKIAESWKVGSKKDSDGVLISLFMDEHKVRIDVGYGLEDRLTDVFCAHVIRDVMAPRLRSGDVAGAILAALATIDHAATGRGSAPIAQPIRGRSSHASPWFTLLLLGIWIIPLFFRRGRRFGGIWLGGGGGWSSGGGSSGGSSWGGSSGGGFGGGGASGDW